MTQKSEPVFVRSVSGVVKNLGFSDTVFYGYLMVASLYFIMLQLIWAPYMFPGGNPWIAVALAAVFSIIGATVWGMFSSAMPRSGGDYVFQSRTLSGLIGFVTTGNNMVIMNMFYSYFAAVTIVFGTLSPLCSYLGFILNDSGLTWAGAAMTAPWVVAGLGIVLIVLSTLVMRVGMRPFLLIQRYFMMPASVIGLAVMAGLLLTTTKSVFVSNFNMFAASYAPAPAAGWYDTVIKSATELGYNSNPGFNWWDTLGLAVVATPGMIGVAPTCALLGEIKGAESLRTSVGMLVSATVVSIITYFIAYAGMMEIMGMQFMSSLGFLQFEHSDKVPLPVFIFGPLPGYMLISILSLSAVASFLIGLGFLGTISQSLFNSPLGATRVILAQGMDRALPEPLSRVNKYGSPWNALLLIQGVAVLFAVVLTALPQLATFWSAGALAGAIMFSATAVSALLFPYVAKDIYELSPIAKYKIGGLPLISVLGTIALVWLLIMTYVDLAVPQFGLRGIALYFDIGIYVLVIIVYYAMRLYRKRQGIELTLAFKEIPPA